MKKKSPCRRVSGAALIPALLVPATVYAQETVGQPETTMSQADAPYEGANEIVVTALKRAQSLTSVAASISALDATTLETRGISNINEIQMQTPSLNVGISLGTAQISIRGIGLTIATGAGEPGVAVHLDGVYEARPALSGLAQFDLQRIEVLRGPQGTLYGRNATGGAINFITNPPTDTFEGSAKIGYAEYDEVHAELIASGPVSDAVRARFGVTYTKRADGFLKNIVPGEGDANAIEDIGARGKVSMDLSEDATLDLQMTYLHADESSVYFGQKEPIDSITASLNPTLASALSTPYPSKVAQDTPMLRRTAYSPAATLNWDIGDIHLRSITAYTNIRLASFNDADATTADLAVINAGYRSREVTQELNLSGTAGPVSWLIGGYFLHEKYDAKQNVLYEDGFTAPLVIGGVLIPIPVFVPNDTTIQEFSERRKSYAGFGDATIQLTDSLSIFGGARYSHDRFQLTQTVGQGSAGFSCKDLTNEVSFSAFTPRGGFQFQPTPQQNFYGSVSRGYKGGGLNFGTCNDPYGPEKVTAYEVGYKAQFGGRRLTLNTAAFYYDYRDLQVYQLRPITEGGGSFIDNAPKATIKGVEADATWSPDGHFQINLAGAYVDAKYDEYSNSDSSVLGSGPQDLSGNPITRSPKFTGTVGLQYKTGEIGGAGHLTVRGELYHSSRIYFSEFKKESESQRRYNVVNAFATWESASKGYSFRVYGKTLRTSITSTS